MSFPQREGSDDTINSQTPKLDEAVKHKTTELLQQEYHRNYYFLGPLSTIHNILKAIKTKVREGVKIPRARCQATK